MDQQNKVLVIVPFAFDEQALALRRAQLDEISLSPGIAFDFRPVRAGADTADDFHDSLLMDVSVFEAGCTAQDEGYAAVCIDTVGDSGMKALRSVLDIPVIGAGRVAYLFALMLGRRFSILTFEPWVWDAHAQLGELGLADRCVSVRGVSGTSTLDTLFDGKEDVLFPHFEEAGRQCVQDGADVIVLHSTSLHQVGARVSAATGVPVVNPGPLTYKLAELMLGLRVSHSHAAYPVPPAPKLDMVHAMLAAAAAHESGAVQ